MTDKEFKRLSRAQLIDIIYQLQLQVDKLSEQKQKLEVALADKQLRISSVGSIADAALEINDCFRSAQRAAEQYLNEIEKLRDAAEADRRRILAKARKEALQLVAEAKTEAQQRVSAARKEAKEILDCAKHAKNDYDAAVEAILKEYKASDEASNETSDEASGEASEE